MRTKNTSHVSQVVSHSTQFPENTRIVFRVFDSTSFRAYDPATGFSAADFDENTRINDSGLIKAHCDPNNRTIVTPWISTTRSWLWAVWEMNRRYESQYKDLKTPTEGHLIDIRVAVIDLSVCQETEGSSTFPPPQPPVFRMKTTEPFEDLGEILIYGGIPAPAIISVWKLEKLFGIQGLPRLYAFQIPSLERCPSFHEVRRQLIEVISSPPQRASWKATEEGERCASIATAFLKVGYEQLERQIDRMIKPIREVQSRASGEANKPSSDEDLNSLASQMGSLSTGQGSSKAPRPSPVAGDNASDPTQFSPPNHTHKTFSTRSGAAKARRTNRRRRQDSKYIVLPSDVQIARQKIERFRGNALEFARTVPNGVLEQLNIDQHDWGTMQLFMMGHINAWLAPLERKLDGLEDNTIADQKIQAQLRWLGKEGKYSWRDLTY